MINNILATRIDHVVGTLIGSWETVEGQSIREIIKTSAENLLIDTNALKLLVDEGNIHEGYYEAALTQGAPESLSCVFSDGARSYSSSLLTKLDPKMKSDPLMFVKDLLQIKYECEEHSNLYRAVYDKSIPPELADTLTCYEEQIIPEIDALLAELT